MRTIGSSQAAALLDRSPWLTRWALHQWLAGRCDLPYEDDERKLWGRLHQPIIMAEAGRRMGLTVVENEVKVIRPVTRRSATLDADVFAVDSEHPGIIECKTIDRMEWLRHGQELPIQYELQLQWQYLVTGRTWGRVALLIGGNELLILDRPPQPKVMRALADAADRMIEDVHSGAPAPDPACLPMELPLLAQVYPLASPPKILPLGINEPAALTVATYDRARELRLGYEKAEAAAKAALLDLVRENATVTVTGGGRAWTVRRVDVEMPAQTIRRKAGRQTRITVKAVEVDHPPAPPTAEDEAYAAPLNV